MGGGPKMVYPKYVWSPAGGWYCNPRSWKRNTAFALMASAVVASAVTWYSFQIERRYHLAPEPVWSHQFAKHAEIDDPRWIEIKKNRNKNS